MAMTAQSTILLRSKTQRSFKLRRAIFTYQFL